MAKKPPLYPHKTKSQMRETKEELPRERDIREARELTSQALDILNKAWHMDDFDSALWRLVDAAGLTARYSSLTAVGTVNSPTGRGYYIDLT